MSEKVEILGVRFDKVTLSGALEKSIAWAKGKEQKQIATPNPEILLTAHKDKKFLKILNRTDLNIPDGVGILWAAKYSKITENTKSNFKKFLKWKLSFLSMIFLPSYIKSELTERVTGTDLMEEICKNCPENNLKIFLLGGGLGIAEKTKEKLEKKYPNIQITGTYSGSPKEKYEKEILAKINRSSADILFVAFGAPNQELWINRNLKKMLKVHLAIGVGGAFDFISGKKSRAPKLVRNLRLEWLYRLVIEPSRIKRIYNAAIKFPLVILKNSLKSPHK